MSGCYDRRGDERTDQYRCDPDPDGTVKACCNAGNSCATNGLCISNEESITPYYIHGCTVEDWDVDTCPRQCYNSTGNGIQPCGNGTFCCYGQVGCDCENEDEVFSMGSVRVFTSIPLDATHETSTSIETTSTPSTASTTLVSTTTLTANTSTTTTTAVPAESTQTGDLSPDSSGGSSINLGTSLGIGLGIGVPLTLVAMSIVWCMRKKHSAAATSSSSSTGRSSNDSASSGKPYVEDIETPTGTSPHPSTLSKHHSFIEYFSPKEQSLSPLSPLPPSEAPVRRYAEMDGAHYRREMDTTTSPRYELHP